MSGNLPPKVAECIEALDAAAEDYGYSKAISVGGSRVTENFNRLRLARHALETRTQLTMDDLLYEPVL